jgi:hypothetical protein
MAMHCAASAGCARSYDQHAATSRWVRAKLGMGVCAGVWEGLSMAMHSTTSAGCANSCGWRTGMHR